MILIFLIEIFPLYGCSRASRGWMAIEASMEMGGLGIPFLYERRSSSHHLLFIPEQKICKFYISLFGFLKKKP